MSVKDVLNEQIRLTWRLRADFPAGGEVELMLYFCG